MSASAIASRYAKSLLDIAVEQGSLENIYQDMLGFKEALKSRDLVLLLKSPIVSSSKKQSAFKAVFADKSNELTMKFFEIVIRKGREGFLPEIADSFVHQYRAQKNISSARVISAKKLSDEQLEKVKQKINGFVSSTNVEISEVIDESLIGGFILEVGDKRYDASVKGQLNKLKKAFS